MNKPMNEPMNEMIRLNRARHPYVTSMENFVFHQVSQRNMLVLVFVEAHALAVKSNLGKIWSNCNFKIFTRKGQKS